MSLPGGTTAPIGSADALPPHDTEAEAGALGCILCAHSREEAVAMLGQLAPEDWYDLRHRTVYDELCELRRECGPLDTVSLSQRLKDKGKLDDLGGSSWVDALPDATPSPANFPTFLETVKDRTMRRAAVSDTNEVLQIARNQAVPISTVHNAMRRLGESYAGNGNGNGLTIRKPDELLAMTFDDSDRILGDRLIATGQSFAMVGAGGLGKSRILLQLAAATITGRQWLGFETRGHELRWLILQAENSNRRLQADLKALRDWAGGDWPKVNERLLIHTLETELDGFLSLDYQDTQGRIAARIQEAKPDIVVFDSLYNFGIGDLNKDQDMSSTLLSISRLTKSGNPNRSPVVLHHALTGKAGAARASGYERSSHGRNSKVLFAWTRGQINIAPGNPDNNETLVLACGKCSNGKEFEPFAVRLNPGTMIYELDPDFDLAAWKEEVTGTKNTKAKMSPERVRDLCKGTMTKLDLVKAIMADCGCSRPTAYRRMDDAERRRKIHWTEATGRMSPDSVSNLSH